MPSPAIQTVGPCVGRVAQCRHETVDSFTQNTALSTKVNSAAVLGNKFGPKSDSFYRLAPVADGR